jgi:L-ascorbate metabolism protein UlaG (beta-lactamase superfamily)
MAHKEKRYVPAKRDGRFECQVHEVKHGFLWDTATSLLKSSWAHLCACKKDITIDWYSPVAPVERSQELRVTWIGHATVLVQVAGLNILTDPIFGASSILYPRVIKPGIALKDLPPIDLVLVSHSHYDHMESKSVRALYKKNPHITFLVPQGNKAWFEKRSIAPVVESVWWDTYTKDSNISCTFLPAVHWTQRGLFDRNRSLWGSWMIEVAGVTVYFGGDTAFGPHFATIANEFNSIDLAILPIGPCEPRDAMKHAHMDSNDAIQACKILKANNFFPIHWGTFRFGDELPRLPIDRLQQQWEQLAMKKEASLVIPKAGQFYAINSGLSVSDSAYSSETSELCNK